MPSVSEQIRYNWNYQYRLGEEVLVPLLIQKNVFHPGDSVFEVGCGEGGVLTTFAKAGVKTAVGTDIHDERLIQGKAFISVEGQSIELSHHNILEDDIPEKWRNQFDLILLRDVIEHLEDTRLALQRIKFLMKKGAFLFITFPPYYSPFGAHQHIVKNFWGKFPYIQMMPKAVFFKMIQSGRKLDVQEVIKMRDIQLSPEKLKRAALQAGFKVYSEDYYILRPVFKMKFGLPELKLPRQLNGDFFQNVCSTEAAFILQAG